VLRSGAPRPAPGVLASSHGEGGVLYEPRSGQIHVLNATGWRVWQLIEAGHDLREVLPLEADEREDGRDHDVEHQVAAFCEQLEHHELVGWSHAPPPLDLSEEGRCDVDLAASWTATYDVMGTAVQVCLHDGSSAARELIDALAALDHLRTTTLALPNRGHRVLCITATRQRHWHIRGAGRLHHGEGVDRALETVIGVLNQIAATSTEHLVLHAAALRSPDGRTVVIPGRSGAGKSTLAAQMVERGWSYFSDEAVGIRAGGLGVIPYAKPLTLEDRAHDGGVPAGRVTAVPAAQLAVPGPTTVTDPPALVVLAAYAPDRPREATPVNGTDALLAVAEHALNLRHGGQRALDTLVALTAQTPCWRFAHRGGSEELDRFTALVEGSATSC
jgi:hypothetical protein